MMTFTKEQLAALRKIAQQATQGEWRAFISSDTGTYAVHTPGDERCGDIIKWPGFDDQKNAENNARYIAAFNPKVVLALLDVLDASLEVELVAWTDDEELQDVRKYGFGEIFQCPPDKYADPRRVIPLYRVPDGMHELYAAPPVRRPDGREAVAWKVTFTQVDQESNTFTAIYFDKAEVTHWVRLHKACDFRADITPLYAAPPVPDKFPREYIRGWPLAHSDYAEGWNDCREAMLNGKGE